MFLYEALSLFLVLGIYLIFFVCLFWFVLPFLLLFCFIFILVCFFLFLFCSVVVVFVCFFCFGLSCSPLRHFPSVFYFFLPIAVTSYKRCVNILAGYTSMLGVISRGKCIYIVEPVLRLTAPTQ